MIRFGTLMLLFCAAGSVFLACKGSAAAGALMHHPAALWSFGGFGVVLILFALRALFKRRWLSALFHGAAAYLIAGALMSALGGEQPSSGYLPLASGDYDTRLYSQDLSEKLYDLPFTVTMNRFSIATYPDSAMPKQYFSDLTLTASDGAFEVRKTASVNTPIRFQGWTIYQMSYGQGQNVYTGEAVIYSILFFSRDSGVVHVFIAFGLILAGTAWLMIRSLMKGKTPCT